MGWEATSTATPFRAKPVSGRLTRAAERRRALADEPEECRAWPEPGGGWPALVETRGASTTPAADGGAVAATDTGAVSELTGITTCLGTDPPDEARCSPPRSLLPAALLGREAAVEVF